MQPDWTCWRVRRSNVLLGGQTVCLAARLVRLCGTPLLASLGGYTLRSGEGSSGKLHLCYCCRALVLQLTGDLLLDQDALQLSQCVGPQQHPRKHLRKLSFC